MSETIIAHWFTMYSHELQGMSGMGLRSRGTTGTTFLAVLYPNLECKQILSFFARSTQLEKGKGFLTFEQLIIGLEIIKLSGFPSQGL